MSVNAQKAEVEMLNKLVERRRKRHGVVVRNQDDRPAASVAEPGSRALRHRLAARIDGNWDQEREELIGELLDCVHALRVIPNPVNGSIGAASTEAAIRLVDVVTSIYRMAAIEDREADGE